MEHQEQVTALKNAVDTASVGIALGTFFQWLPSATALLTFLWVCIRLYETRTVQAIVARLRGEQPAVSVVPIKDE